MFQPQNVTCPYCLHQRQIITEDIPARELQLCCFYLSPGIHAWACLECPDCGHRFCLYFMEKTKTKHIILFECLSQGNVGLTMWKEMDGFRFMIPSYSPNVTNRTVFERTLDDKALSEANRIYPWQHQTGHAKTLADYLGEIEDYTKHVTWKKFKKGQLIVAFCAHDGADSYYRGFNGLFKTVKVKNAVLRNEYSSKLEGQEECYSKNYCHNKIGHCAEMHAANLCLNAEPAPDTNDLRFSIAYQCRTATPRSYCLNCVTLFQNVNNG